MSLRYPALVKVSDRALDTCTNHITYERVASCYPTIAALPDGPETLRECIDTLTGQWARQARQAFEDIFVERGARAKLDELDQLCAEARQRRDTYSQADLADVPISERPVDQATLSPRGVVDAHLEPAMRAELERLETELAQSRQENKSLLDTIQRDQSLAQDLAQRLHEALEGVRTSLTALENVPADVPVDLDRNIY